MRSPTSASLVLRSIIFVSLRMLLDAFSSGFCFRCGMLDGLPDAKEGLPAHAPDLGFRPPPASELVPEGTEVRRVLEPRGYLDEAVEVAPERHGIEAAHACDRVGVIGHGLHVARPAHEG